MALQALARCRGPVLADLSDSVRADPAVAELARVHARAVHRLTEDCLATGQPELVLPHLEMVRSDRLDDERIAADLAIALAAAGRQAQGLAVLDDVTRRLAEELGVSPGPPIGTARLRVLGADGVTRPRAAPPSVAEPGRPPAQLPLDVFRFSGRRAELARLDVLLDNTDVQPGTVVISAVAGTAGVGKTALAVHWAHHVRHRFPDGQLYVNLRGFDPAQSPTSPTVALRDFLSALGIPADRIPEGVQAQANQFRTTVAERRILMVLDNARDAEQVRPLVGLVAAEGAHPLTLDPLSTAEAYDLLAMRLGADRVRGEPSAAQQIIEYCAGLPLALAIVAARLATNSKLSLALVAAELTRMRSPLDGFSGEDTATDIRTVFSWSYRILDANAARLFRLVGLLQVGTHIGAMAAANLAGMSQAQAQPLLDRLVRGHLLTEPAPGRYAFHDLLRAYAAELAHATDAAPDREAALGRLLDYYTYSARAAAAVLQYFDLPAPPVGQVEVHAEAFTSAEPALAWLVTERAALVAMVDRAYNAGFFTHSWHIARNVQDFLVAQGHWHEMNQVQRVALAAARQTDHSAAQVSAHRAVAHAQTLLGRHEQAEEHLRSALRLAGALGDPVQLAYCEHNLAIVRQAQGRRSEALEYERRAQEDFELAGNTQGVILTLNGMAWLLITACEYDQALEYGHRALAVVRTTGAWPREATVLDTIAYAHLHLGQNQLAVDHFKQGLDLSRKAGNRYQEAAILARLGDAHQAGAEWEPARTAWRQAVEILETIDQAPVHPRAQDGYNNLPDAASLEAKLRDA